MAEFKDHSEAKASTDAVEFMSTVARQELQQCLFADSLVTISDTGRELGEFTVTVENAVYNNEMCYLIHANSHGSIDDIPCGTSVMAYVSERLETLEQHHHEYVKLRDHPLDRKSHVIRQDDHLVVNKIITEREDVKKQSFRVPLSSLEGFVSEASNLLILRVLAKRRHVPESMIFLAFDAETHICTSVYKELGVKNQTVEKEGTEVFGIERTVQSEDDIPTTWHSYFLSDGHLSSRVQVGSPVMMKLMQMPAQTERDEKEIKTVIEKKPLVWEEDMQLYSRFLDRKEELKASHASYVRHHPELKVLMADFLQFLLLRKPNDIFSFAAEYFAPFSSQRNPGNTFMSSNKTNPFR